MIFMLIYHHCNLLYNFMLNFTVPMLSPWDLFWQPVSNSTFLSSIKDWKRIPWDLKEDLWHFDTLKIKSLRNDILSFNFSLDTLEDMESRRKPENISVRDQSGYWDLKDIFDGTSLSQQESNLEAQYRRALVTWRPKIEGLWWGSQQAASAPSAMTSSEQRRHSTLI